MYASRLFDVLLLTSSPVVALFAAGTVFAILLLFHFLKEERYRRLPRLAEGVEFVSARRVVETQFSALAPRAILLAEKEKFVAGHLERGALSEEARLVVEGLLRDSSDEFWESFVKVSALAESDPVRAYGELPHLYFMAETALEKLNRVEEVVYGGTEP